MTGIVGNPAAVVQKKRFIEYNLNRMVREDLFHKRSYESERARVLADAISNCDILLDLHSCSAHAPAHALPAGEPRSVSIAKQLLFLLSYYNFSLNIFHQYLIYHFYCY